jgi:hypothetical protein
MHVLYTEGEAIFGAFYVGGAMIRGLLSFSKMTFFEGILGEFPPIIL